jgi:endoglucanase
MPIAGASGAASLSIRVQGSHLIDSEGHAIQLRGVSVSGLDFVAIQGWSRDNPWGQQTGTPTPDWNAIKTWNANAVRIPLNEASWLGYVCVDSGGAKRDPDPGHNYQATVKKAVAEATAAGLYVILDLHISAPGNLCPLVKNAMPDADNAPRFWTSVAGTFKNNAAVMFELFSEPFPRALPQGESAWTVLRNGGIITQVATGGNPAIFAYTWKAAGMQQLVDAVRNTGASNVVLIGTINWSQELSNWLANRPTDPLQQTAAAWHAYPVTYTRGSPDAALPNYGPNAYTWAQNILAAGVPVVITETGDGISPGNEARFLANLLPWADGRCISYFGWAWDVWRNGENVLIKDASGTPTDGYGAYFKQHLTSAAVGGAHCR